MSKREPLKVGETVICYAANIHSSNVSGQAAQSWGPFKGRITAVNVHYGTQPGFIAIEHPMGGWTYAHPKQCRRLRPRAKPEEPKERVYVWMYKREGECPKFFFHEQFTDARDGYEITNLSVIRPGEIILSRADLAKAWDLNFTSCSSHGSPIFWNICKFLGLGAP